MLLFLLKHNCNFFPDMDFVYPFLIWQLFMYIGLGNNLEFLCEVYVGLRQDFHPFRITGARDSGKVLEPLN